MSNSWTFILSPLSLSVISKGANGSFTIFQVILVIGLSVLLPRYFSNLGLCKVVSMATQSANAETTSIWEVVLGVFKRSASMVERVFDVVMMLFLCEAACVF